MTRITILWAGWSGYMDVCARQLVERHGCDVTIVYETLEKEAPYDMGQFFQYPCRAIPYTPGQNSLPLEPDGIDILLVCSWHIQAYKQFAKSMADRCVRVLCMDNHWLGKARQWLGVISSPLLIAPYYDCAFVPGRRQADFARRLGFADQKIVQGHYACDYDRFSTHQAERSKRPLSRKFVFVGRLVPVKGIAPLFAAWEQFTALDSSWSLQMIGAGDYRAGPIPPKVEFRGFFQPAELPNALLDGDVFVLPSLFEPWGLVIHEAAATGMPIICSDACGAGDAFVEDGLSGKIVKSGNSEDLLRGLQSLASASDPQLRAMGNRSAQLAGARTPYTWSDMVVAMWAKFK